MTLLARLGLRTRLALAFVGVAVLAVGLATLLSNRGLAPRLEDAARARLDRSARELATTAGASYAQAGGWTNADVGTLAHLSMMSGLRVSLLDAGGRAISTTPGMMGAPSAVTRANNTASAEIMVGGRRVGTVLVSQASGDLLTPEESHLQHSLDRLHLAAGAASVAAALLIAFLLAQGLSRPLRRIRLAAQRIEQGDLSARVELGGDPEVREVGHALNRLAETLEHEEELRKETVADIAHELRTPVTGILSRIEAAQDGVLADEAANLEAMHMEALRLARLLDDLAMLAEAERPGLLIDKRPVDLAKIAEQEVEEWRARFEAKGLQLGVELEQVWVSGDPDRLSQICANLLSNAARYTEPGGGVHVRVAREANLAVLEVEDTGIGIAPEDLRHIFTRFWRGEKSRSRATGGAGIGLAIVRELVRAHDGRIDVESGLGRGSCFLVLLPEAAAARDGEHLATAPARERVAG
jgi:signal transduction histidine kinase